MKKKIFGSVIGVTAMIVFTMFNSIDISEAQDISIDPSGTYDLGICQVAGQRPTAACNQMAIAGPCWTYTACN